MSSGPKTPEGKSTSRLNARKHGLSSKLPLGADDQQTSLLIRALMEEGVDRLSAEELARGLLRHRQIMDAYYAIYVDQPASQAAAALRKLERYQRRALSQITKTIAGL